MIIEELFEGPQLCPECGGISFSDLILAEKKDACYYKVKASAKVWPSAYASGRLVQCRKKGAANYGNKSESVAEGKADYNFDIEDLKRLERIRDLATLKAQALALISKPSAKPMKPEKVEWFKNALESMNSPMKVIKLMYDLLLSGEGNAVVGTRSSMNPNSYRQRFGEQDIAEDQLDEKWSQKYKSSINCANPRGFSQRAHCAGRKKNEGVEESLGKQIHSTFQSMGDSFSDAHLAKGISYFLQGRHQEGENWLRGKIPQAAQDTVFSKLRTLQAQGGVDVNKNANVQQYIDDKLVPWVKNQIQQNIKETRRGQVPMTLPPGETDNIEPENISGFRTLPAYKQGQAAQQKAGKQLIQKSPYTYQSDQDWAYRQGAFDTQQAAMFANFGKSKPLTTEAGEQQPGADYRDPREVNYDDEYDAMVARVKRLAGLGPMRTVYDPAKRQYRNMPTAQQPKK